MAIDVEELVIQPFREVVERGREAGQNAETEEHGDPRVVALMQKAARGLVKEGERALQRLQPIWEAQVDKHGEAFMDAVRDNDEILEKQRTLEDLLYDLDDYVAVDSFEPDRFAQVQSASKAYALTLLETIKRLRIVDTPLPPPTPTTTASTIPPWPQPKLVRIRKAGGRGEVQEIDLNDPHNMRRPSSPEMSTMGRDSVPQFSRKGVPLASSHGSPTSPRISAWVNEQTHSTNLWDSNQNQIPRQASFSNHPVANNLDRVTLRGLERGPARPYSPVTAGSRSSAYTTTDSNHSGRRSSMMVPTSESRTTSLAHNIPASAIFYDKKTLPPVPMPLSPPASFPGHSPRIVSDSPTELQDQFDNGLMLANESVTEIAEPSLSTVDSNCQITPQSTLYQLKGFCEGAQKFKRDNHKAATKAAMEYGTNGSVARCLDCEFRCGLAEVELDAKGDAAANYTKANVRHRVRFVYKSHLPTNMAHTVKYGCLFCVQAGHTFHEGDSTVFTKEEHLFQHLARHPQPLPKVPGVTVLYGEVSPENPLKEDYDLHFPNPPAADPYPSPSELYCMPTAVAVKNHERRYGEKPLADPDGGKDILQFFSGSRIVGIEFPESWKGKWAYGWQNGVRGSFPLKLVSMQSPRRLPGMEFSGLAVKTRWKLDFKDQGQGWLSFGVDETISNVTWVSESDWCWAGMTKKGKSGLFPKSFVHAASVYQDGRPRTSGGVKGFGGGGSLMRRFTTISSD